MGNVRVIKDRILVKEIKEEEKTDGAFIVTKNSSNLMKGEVVGVGNGELDNPMEVKVGDKIMFQNSSYYKLDIDGEELIVLTQSQVIAILD